MHFSPSAILSLYDSLSFSLTRILCEGSRVVGAMHRKRRDGVEEFRNNVAMNAVDIHPVSDIPPAWTRIALDACRACNVTVGGVDIVRSFADVGHGERRLYSYIYKQSI